MTFAEYLPIALSTEAPAHVFASQVVCPVREVLRVLPSADPCVPWPAWRDQDASLYNGPLIRLAHAVVGLATEAGEILSATVRNRYEGAPIDLVDVKEEVGDAFWYVAIAFDVLGVEAVAFDDAVRGAGPPDHERPGGCAPLVDGLVVRSLKTLEFVKKRLYYPKPLDRDEVFQHVADVATLLLELCAWFEFDPHDVLEANVRKLTQVRYKAGFETEAANVRDFGAERAMVAGVYVGDERVYAETGRLVGTVDGGESNVMSSERYARLNPNAAWYPGYGFKETGL